MADITQAGHCARGAKNWFERKGLDFRGFLKDGIAAEALLATDDAIARQVVERKIQRDWLAEDLSKLTITIDDVRASGQCGAGVRAMAARHGLDYGAFLEEGISASSLIATGDGAALRIVLDRLERDVG